MKTIIALASLVALGLSAAFAQQPAPPTPSPDAGANRPTREHVGRGTEDDVQPSAPKGEAASAADARTTSFETADKDKDGKLSRGEASSVPNVDFARADTNRDSSLSREEFLAMTAKRPQREDRP